MVQQLIQGLMIDKLQRWRFDSSSVNEDLTSASKGHATEQWRGARTAGSKERPSVSVLCEAGPPDVSLV